MKKIIFVILVILIFPLIIIDIYDNINVSNKDVHIKYIDNYYIRVKRLKTGIIESIPLEEYIIGVLAGEMPIYFEKEALKAQAVAARSYALKRIEYNKSNDYDVVDSTLNQVYLDNIYLQKVWGSNYEKNISKLKEVVIETYNEYLDYDGKVIDAMFFSTSNGYTEASKLVFNIELPYLQSVESSWDKNVSSAFLSEKVFLLKDFCSLLNINCSNKLDVKILKKSATNRILSISINNKEFSGRYLYNKLSLKSTDFSIEEINGKVIIKMKGYGHGVGMSQYGAEGMAREGYTYDEILSHYYKNTEIKKLKI